MDYTRASGHVLDRNGRRQFENRDLANGVSGTSITGDDLNGVFNTLMDTILAFGGEADPDNDSLLTAAIRAAVKFEASRAQQAEDALQENISDEATARANADDTIQANVTSEAAARANADASLQSQINNKVGTNPADDGINSPVTMLSLYNATLIPWIGSPKSTEGISLVKSAPATGFNQVLNLSTDGSGALVVPDSSGKTRSYSPTSSGKIAASGNLLGGYWVKTGNILRQIFTYTANYGDFIHFPTEYAEAPVVHVTAAAYGGMATTANILGSPVYNGFTFISSVYAGNPNRLDNTGANTISVMVEGLVNS